MKKPLSRQWWHRVYFPKHPDWLWPLVIVARRHGFGNRNLWQFILQTVRAQYPEEWDAALKASNMKRRQHEIDDPPDELK